MVVGWLGFLVGVRKIEIQVGWVEAETDEMRLIIDRRFEIQDASASFLSTAAAAAVATTTIATITGAATAAMAKTKAVTAMAAT